MESDSARSTHQVSLWFHPWSVICCCLIALTLFIYLYSIYKPLNISKQCTLFTLNIAAPRRSLTHGLHFFSPAALWSWPKDTHTPEYGIHPIDIMAVLFLGWAAKLLLVPVAAYLQRGGGVGSPRVLKKKKLLKPHPFAILSSKYPPTTLRLLLLKKKGP